MRTVRSTILGYCQGVRETINRASECLQRAAQKGLPAYSIGNLIHNPDVIRTFEKKGLKVINEPAEAAKGVALIRAHGIPDKLRQEFTDAGFELLDSTCSIILHTQKFIRQECKNRVVAVIGVRDHAETKCLSGTMACDGREIESVTVSSVEDLEAMFCKYGPDTAVCVVTQTTFPPELYRLFHSRFSAYYRDVVFANGLCGACTKRSETAVELLKKNGSAVVIGGRQSENTANLAKALAACGKPVVLIENRDDLDEKTLRLLFEHQDVVVCSGTSTPDDVIDSVVSELEQYKVENYNSGL